MSTQIKILADALFDASIEVKSLSVTGEYTLPVTAGTDGQVMVIDASGQVNFVDILDLDGLTTASLQNGTGLTWTVLGPSLVQGDVSLATFTTDDLAEGSTNKYYTDEYVDDRVFSLMQDSMSLSWTYDDLLNTMTADVTLAPFTTDSLAEGVTNKYYNDELVDDRVASLLQSAVIGTDPINPIVWNYVDGLNRLIPQVSIAPFDTDDLAEGSANLYYQDEYVDDRISTLIQDSSSVTWTYDDFANTLTAEVVPVPALIDFYIDGSLVGTRGGFDLTVGPGLSITAVDDSVEDFVGMQISNQITNLSALDDVELTSPIANGEVLAYDEISGIWTNAVPSITAELNDLTDVTLLSGGPLSEDILVFNGTTWINSPRLFKSSGGIGSIVSIDVNNTASGELSSILSGKDNLVETQYSSILSGLENLISGFADYSIIGGGQSNSVTALNSGIFTGQSNIIDVDASYSVILGGRSNTLNGLTGTILGGESNRLSHSNSLIGGSSITSLFDNTFHLNNLCIYDTPQVDSSNSSFLVRDNSTGLVNVRPYGGFYAQTSDSATITNTTSELSLIGAGQGTLSVPANMFKIGDTFKIKMSGLLSSVNGHTVTIRVKSTNTTTVELATTGAITLPSITAKNWELEVTLTVRSIGTAGVASIITSGIFSYTQNSGSSHEGFGFTTLATTNFQTIDSQTLSITAQFGTASASDSIYSHIFVLHKVY